MLKKTFIALALPLLSLLAIGLATPQWSVSAQPAPHTPRSPQRAGSAVTKAPRTGTFQKMIVENGSVTMDLDLNGFEWKQFVGRKAGHTAIRYRRQFLLSHSSV